MSPRACAYAMALALASSPAVFADGMYSVIDLGTDVSGLRIGQSGAVAGLRAQGYEKSAFLYRNGAYQDLGTSATPLRVTPDNRVITNAGVPFDTEKSTSFDRTVYYTQPGVGANDQGQVVGTADYDSTPYFPSPIGTKQGYIYTPFKDAADRWSTRDHLYGGRAYAQLPIATAQESYFNAINNAGTVAGAVLMKNDVTMPDGTVQSVWSTHAIRGQQDLGTLSGDSWATSLAINENGHVVGLSGQSQYYAPNGFFAGDDGKLILLPSLLQPSALNNLDAIVGKSGSGHALLFHVGDQAAQDLNGLIPNTGWILNEAVGINDAGQIVGYGTIHGETHGFLLSPEPIPEPATFLAWGGAVASIAVVRRYRRKRA